MLLGVVAAAPRLAERGGQKGSLSGGPGTQGARGSELSGLECKIHQLKLRLADAMMFFFFISGQNSIICGRYDLILLITRC